MRCIEEVDEGINEVDDSTESISTELEVRSGHVALMPTVI